MTENKQMKLIKKASMYIDKKKFLKAARCLRSAYKEDGKFNALILYFLGMVYDRTGHYIESVNCLVDAVEYLKHPKNVISKDFEYKIFFHLASAAATAGLTGNALQFYDEAIKHCNESQKIGILLPYVYTMVSGNTSPEHMMQGLAKINAWLPPVQEMPQPAIDEKNEAVGDRIHIAYLSPDYRAHVMYNFYYGIFKYYDREKFYITCIYLDKQKDDCTKEVQSMVDDFRFCAGMSYPQIVAMLKGMHIDIAVDLAGHTSNSGLGLFRYRIAPVQISGLGWMESTGLKETDYLITDRQIDPPGKYYISEKPLYLDSCFCYLNDKALPQPEHAPCRDKGYITFGSFNRVNKFTDPMLIVWREILDRVPKARLLLKTKAFNTPKTLFFIKDRLQKIGIDIDRVMFEGTSKEYMERYLDVDIALDTYPYCGGGTTCDALYMGVPVVSLYGERRSSKFGLSILHGAGLGELAVDTPEAYINLAVRLANDWDTLDALHVNLRSMMKKSNIMNGARYAAELEKQYVQILQKQEACVLDKF